MNGAPRTVLKERARRGARGLRLVVLGAAVVWAAALGAVLAPTAAAVEDPEWQHALWVAAELRNDPPSDPVVVMLGGSCVREATTSDKDWVAAVKRAGGGTVITRNLGSRLQTFEQEAALVKALPDLPIIVIIGINPSRFTVDPTVTTSTEPPAAQPTFWPHHYSVDEMWTPERKRKRLRYWLEVRSKVFDHHYDGHLADLEKVIKACEERGYTPVLMPMPNNLEIVGDALDPYIDRCEKDAQALARKYGIAYLDFSRELPLTNEDFYDLEHLVEPGREIFQARLAQETARLVGAREPAGETAWGRALGVAVAGILLLGAAGLTLRRRAVVRARASTRHARRAETADARRAETSET